MLMHYVLHNSRWFLFLLKVLQPGVEMIDYIEKMEGYLSSLERIATQPQEGLDLRKRELQLTEGKIPSLLIGRLKAKCRNNADT